MAIKKKEDYLENEAPQQPATTAPVVQAPQTAQLQPMQTQAVKSTDTYAAPKQSSKQAVGSYSVPVYNGYSTAGIDSKTEAEQALAGASYDKSQAVIDAETALEQWEGSRPQDYESLYKDQIDALLDQVLNRESFSYDFNADPLYQQYKDQYQHNGLLAMQDTMANAAAATGGYGSSYAASAGQQAYQGNLANLNGIIPELYGQALGQYNAEGAEMRNNISMLSTQEATDYAAYQQALANFERERDYLTGQADSTYAKDYGAYQDYYGQLGSMVDYYAQQEAAQKEREFAAQQLAEQTRRWEAEMAAQRQAAAQAQANWEAELAAKAAAAAASRAQAQTSKSTKKPELENLEEKWGTEIERRTEALKKEGYSTGAITAILNGEDPNNPLLNRQF